MKILIISTIAAIVVFIIKYIFTYRYLTLHKTQEPITSFPASSAWTTALPIALLAFVIALVILYLFFRK